MLYEQLMTVLHEQLINLPFLRFALGASGLAALALTDPRGPFGPNYSQIGQLGGFFLIFLSALVGAPPTDFHAITLVMVTLAFGFYLGRSPLMRGRAKVRLPS